MRDSKRSKVYAAERAAFRGNEKATTEFKSVRSAQSFVNRVIGSKWWKEYDAPRFAEGGSSYRNDLREHSITVKSQANRYRTSTAGYDYEKPFGGFSDPDEYIGFTVKVAVINLAPGWGFQKWVILHELAHHLNPELPSHGRLFCRVYLDLVGHWLGTAAKKRLREEFTKRGVKYSKPQSEASREVIAACRR